ncbi:MAG: hypothetical protein R3Y11_05705 [Pseudomonadota bacterium]
MDHREIVAIINTFLQDTMPVSFYAHEDTPDYTMMPYTEADIASFLHSSKRPCTESTCAPTQLATSFLDMVHPCDVERMQDSLEQARNTKQSYKTVFILKGNEKNDRFVFNYAIYKETSHGRGYFFGILLDVNEVSSQQEMLLLQRSAHFDSQSYKYALVGTSLALRILKEQLLKVAVSSAFALLLGESGVGNVSVLS